MLSEQQISDYNQHGYVLVEGAIPATQLAQMQSVTAELIEQSREVRESNDNFDLDQGHSARSPQLTRIKTPHTQHAVYWSALTSPFVLGCMQSLLGQHIRLGNSKLNTKAGHGGAAVQWHQDWAYYPHTNDDLLAIGIMLSNISEDDGSLLVVPGSHRGPVSAFA